MEEDNKLMDLSVVEGAIKEEQVLHEPHKIFIVDIDIKEEPLEESTSYERQLESSSVLPPTQMRSVQEESVIHSVIEEETIVGNLQCDEDIDEGSLPLSYVNTVIKEEFTADGEHSFPVEEYTSDGNNIRTKDTNEGNVCNSPYGQIDMSSLLKTCGSSEVYRYDKCNKQVRPSEIMPSHELLCSSLNIYQCGICHKKTFINKKNVLTHLSVCKAVKSTHQCDICNEVFSYKSQLSAHNLIHTGIKSYKCEICNKSFARKCSLSTHLLTHSKIKNYQCQICSKQFKQKGSLSRHMVYHHRGVKRYRCQICNKNFKTKGNLLKHNLTLLVPTAAFVWGCPSSRVISH